MVFTVSPSHTAFVILEYCGGAKTDALHRRLCKWNPGRQILVLDNASPGNLATCATHRNPSNSYVGGGIRDCIALAQSLGARYLFYCVNDLELLDPLVIADFQGVMDRDDDVVLLSASVSKDSHQASLFPWMVRKEGGLARRVRFADLLCCLLRLDFIGDFGGFPPSKGGWGYARELAHHARKGGKKIYVSDACSVRHLTHHPRIVTTEGRTVCKGHEAVALYRQRYGAMAVINAALAPPDFDETLDFDPLGAKRRGRTGSRR
jgi:hypothetical protein